MMVNSSQSTLRLTVVFAMLLLVFTTTAVLAASTAAQHGLFDRGVIAFIRQCSARTDGLFQLDIAHQIDLPLSNRYSGIYSLSYSPLGSWLVFEAMERNWQGFFRHLYAIDLQTQAEYQLAPEYVSFNGIPLNWQSDGKSLELRMMATGSIALEDIVVNVANGEVVDRVPVSDPPSDTGIVVDIGASTTALVPIPLSNVQTTMNNRVDADTSADGQIVRSRMHNRRFDLFVQTAHDADAVQVTNDDCIERYPRWQPGSI